jgi:hypothetical protein
VGRRSIQVGVITVAALTVAAAAVLAVRVMRAAGFNDLITIATMTMFTSDLLLGGWLVARHLHDQ